MSRQTKIRFKLAQNASENGFPATKRVDSDGTTYSPGPAQRATPQPWNWCQKTLRNGKRMASIVAPFSSDSATTVRYEASLLGPELHQAQVAVRTNRGISIADLRADFPEVDKRCSDVHLRKLIDSDPPIRNMKKFMAEIFADASGYYQEGSIYRMLKFKNSRQVKKPTKGRPGN